jgi:hypothetical protein
MIDRILTVGGITLLSRVTGRGKSRFVFPPREGTSARMGYPYWMREGYVEQVFYFGGPPDIAARAAFFTRNLGS